MNLAQSVTRANMSLSSLQINHATREVRSVPICVSAAKRHGPNCHCEACSSIHMKRTRDKRLKAMVPGDVDMGNRQPAAMGKASANLMMKKVKAADNFPKKQVPPPKRTAKSQMPSALMHDKGTILKGKDFSQGERKKLAKKKQAEPDGSYPIANVADLKRAKQALGRSKNIAKTRSWINKRAKQLKEPGIGG